MSAAECDRCGAYANCHVMGGDFCGGCAAAVARERGIGLDENG